MRKRKINYPVARTATRQVRTVGLPGDPASGTVIVDFNFAYQPSCAFDPRWSCPLSPAENRLETEVRAGELLR